MNWINNRPPNWVAISNKAVKRLKKRGIDFNPASFIAGADAMLEALKKTGTAIEEWTRWQDKLIKEEHITFTPAIGKQLGWLVFIEDKK